MPEWLVIVDGVKLTWEQVVFKLSTGAWTMQEALKHTLFTKESLAARLEVTRAAGGAVGRAASSALVRLGLVEAAAGTGLLVSAGSLTLLGWLTIIGVVAVVGAGGYYAYRHFSQPSTEPAAVPGSVPEVEAAEPPCPPMVRHRTACPWVGTGFTVEECDPGYCWDGGPRGSGACKMTITPANAVRSYTSDVLCNEGLVARRDRCTNVIVSCDPPP